MVKSLGNHSRSNSKSRKSRSSKSRNSSKSSKSIKSRSKSLNQYSTKLNENDLNKIKETMKKLYKNARDEDMYQVKEARDEDMFKKEEIMGGAARVTHPTLTADDVNRWAYQSQNWPGNYGCRTRSNKQEYLFEGTPLDRFGGEWGVYLGKPTDSYMSRSMNRISNRNLNKYHEYYTTDKHHLLPKSHKYHLYEVNKPIYTYRCTTAAAFDKPGGAKQFLVPAIDIQDANDLPLSLSARDSDMVDRRVGQTKFYKISYLLAQNVLTEIEPSRFPSWN
jgi:hypothetical protein